MKNEIKNTADLAANLDGRAIRLYTDRCGIDAALIPYVREMAEAGLVVIVEDEYYLVARVARRAA